MDIGWMCIIIYSKNGWMSSGRQLKCMYVVMA